MTNSKIKIKYKVFLNVFFFLLILVGVSSCRKKAIITNEELIKPNPIFKEKITPEIQAIIDLSYNFNFDESLKKLQALKKKSDVQEIYLLDLLTVGTLFWQYIAAVTEEENNKARDSFANIVGEIKTRTESELEKTPDSLKALYLLGFVEGSQSKFYAIEGDFFKAYRFGVKGFNRLKKIEKLNPDDFDTQFGIGLYKYYCATLLPRWFQRLSVFVPGIDIDREGGYIRIKLANKYAYLLKVEAELALAQGNSSYEREFQLGFELSEQIHKRYPENRVFAYTHIVSMYYLGQNEIYKGKPEKALKTLNKGLRLANENKSFRMHIKKKRYLTADMRWKSDLPSEHEVIFALYLEIARIHFYLNEQILADQILKEGGNKDVLGRNIKAALYFELGRQHKILGKEDYKEYILKAAEIAGENSEIASHCKTFLGSNFVLPEPEYELFKLHQKIVLGKVTIEDVLAVKKKYEKVEYSNYEYNFYEIMMQFYTIAGNHILAEKYHDEVRVHAQLDK
jgi:hypothetical protein